MCVCKKMYIVFVRERERERESGSVFLCVREIKYQNGSLASQTHSLGGGRESGNTRIVKSCNGFLIIFRKYKCGFLIICRKHKWTK